MNRRAFARWGVPLAVLAAAAAAHAQSAPPEAAAQGETSRQSYANPSAAIAAEMEFARMAQEKGQWTAFRAMAAEDAAMFAPGAGQGMVLARDWLKNRANPASGLRWEPHQVWSSCDGSLMVTHGAWRKGQSQGWFTTVWRRERDGRYRWTFDHGDSAAAPIAAPDMIVSRIADCPPRRVGARPAAPDTRRGRPGKPAKPPAAPKVVIPFDPMAREGRSNDGTLTWRVSIDRAGTRDFVVRLKSEGEMREIVSEHVAAGAAQGGS